MLAICSTNAQIQLRLKMQCISTPCKLLHVHVPAMFMQCAAFKTPVWQVDK